MLKIEKKEPICMAPFMCFLVDPNKGVRPCCVWGGPYLGNLEQESVQEIMEGEKWRELKEQMMQNIWPEGCMGCKNREDATGWSVRQQFIKGGWFHSDSDDNDWEDIKKNILTPSITYLEFNGSNICNLACLHCNGGFSTSWQSQEKVIAKAGFRRGSMKDYQYPSHRVHGPNESIVYDVLKNIDHNIERLMIKGGEPFLNTDVVLLLEGLDRMNLLQQLKVNIVTNGSQPDNSISDSLFPLLGKAASTTIFLSIDGVGEVQNYIRYGNGSDIPTIERFIDRFIQNENTTMAPLTSIMAMNVFYLDQLVSWWRSLNHPRLRLAEFRLMVTHPTYVSLRCISEDSKKLLLARYEGDELYDFVIKYMRGCGTDEDLRRRLALYIKTLDDHRGTDCSKSIPEFYHDLFGSGSLME
jgi:MoaA/NifB/PqqE/SkfB family radical SAM enzyme